MMISGKEPDRKEPRRIYRCVHLGLLRVEMGSSSARLSGVYQPPQCPALVPQCLKQSLTAAPMRSPIPIVAVSVPSNCCLHPTCSPVLVNPLTNEYILVSPHRSRRPWLGQIEPVQTTSLPSYDPACYLCPNNTRANGAINPPFDAPYTFENDFAAVLPFTQDSIPSSPHHLLVAEPVHGSCDVLVFHPRHDLTLARLQVEEIQHIIEEWKTIYLRRSNDNSVQYVQIFEV